MYARRGRVMVDVDAQGVLLTELNRLDTIKTRRGRHFVRGCGLGRPLPDPDQQAKDRDEHRGIIDAGGSSLTRDSGVHADRATRRHRHHRRAGLPPFTGCAGSTRGGSARRQVRPTTSNRLVSGSTITTRFTVLFLRDMFPRGTRRSCGERAGLGMGEHDTTPARAEPDLPEDRLPSADSGPQPCDGSNARRWQRIFCPSDNMPRDGQPRWAWSKCRAASFWNWCFRSATSLARTTSAFSGSVSPASPATVCSFAMFPWASPRSPTASARRSVSANDRPSSRPGAGKRPGSAPCLVPSSGRVTRWQ